MIRKLIFLLAAALFALPAVAADFEVDQLGYDILDDSAKTCKVVGYTGDKDTEFDVTIPSSANGYAVTEIADSAFYGIHLRSAVIPSSVTTIGEYAFCGCIFLTEINISSGVTTIGKFAFWGCTGLTSIDIPSGVTTIGRSAFYGCTGLTSINIPSGVTTIESETFYGCTGLTSIDIPSGVTKIEEAAFQRCSGLTSIDIPSSVTTIGKFAFWGCTGLTSIDIPSSVTTIEEAAFLECSGLTSIDIPSGVTTIEFRTFQDCTGLTSVTIPSSVTTIVDYAFSRCRNIEWIACKASNPPDCGMSIFSYIDKTNLYVPSQSVELYKASIRWNNFENISALTEVVLSKNIANGGEVSGAGEYPPVGTAELIATPAEGYTFEGWYIGEELLSADAEYRYAITDTDVTIEARFKPIPNDGVSVKLVDGRIVLEFEAVENAKVYETKIYDENEVLVALIKTEVTIYPTGSGVARTPRSRLSAVTDVLDPNGFYNYSVNAYDADGHLLEQYVGTVEINNGPTTSVDMCTTDKHSGDIEIYDLNGVRIDADRRSLAPGVYIERCGAVVTKIMVR